MSAPIRPDVRTRVAELFDHRDDGWPIHYVNSRLRRPESLCGITDLEPVVESGGSGGGPGRGRGEVCAVCAELGAMRNQLDLSDLAELEAMR